MRCLQLFAFALGLAAGAGEVSGENLTLPGNRDFILQIDGRDRWARLAVHSAITGAFQRLGSPTCRDVLSTFRDGEGRALQDNLEATGSTVQDYLGRLRFTDGSAHPHCGEEGVVAFTAPHQRIVYICGRFRKKFLALRRGERDDLEIAILHEMLHTLGLGENPPTSLEITAEVRRRCGGP